MKKLFLLGVLFVTAVLIAAVTIEKRFCENKQITLKKGGRIVVIYNPTSVYPTKNILVDYKIADPNADVNIVVQGKLY
jgi:hypothetical protein